MQPQTFYDVQQHIRSISAMLKEVVTTSTTSQRYVDQSIKSENLRFNLSLILSRIIMNLQLVGRGEATFLAIIEDYNTRNQKSFQLSDFLDNGFIRVIDDEVRLPEVVASYIRRKGDVPQQPEAIPSDTEGMLECLRSFYRQYYDKKRLSIEGPVLSSLLAEIGVPEVNVGFLLEKDILSQCDGGSTYCWEDNTYCTHLRNEIGSTLWLLMCGDNSTKAEYRTFSKLLHAADVWPDRLDDYLIYDQTKKISDFSVLELDSPDLDDAGNEFKKIWLDAPTFLHVDLFAPTPNANLKAVDSFDLIELIEFHTLAFPDIFDHQESRASLILQIRFMIQYDTSFGGPYSHALHHLKQNTKPFLVWTIYRELSRNFPEVIPYLLSDISLAPIAYKLLDKIGIKADLLAEGLNREEQVKEECDVVNEIWKRMLVITLNQIGLGQVKENLVGQLLYRILLYSARTAFTRPNTGQEVVKQQAHLTRYRETLDSVLKCTHRSSLQSLPSLGHNGTVSIVAQIFEEISGKSIGSRRNEYINLDYPTIDLILELVRSLNNSLRDSPGGDGVNVKMRIIEYLASVMEDYFKAEVVDVTTYSEAGFEKKQVKRGVNDFGTDMIQWGYLYSHFEESNILDQLHTKIIKTVTFDTVSDEGIYSTTNREQLFKLRLYLETLISGYIDVFNNGETYEVEHLPVKNSLLRLEKYIQELSIQHCLDDLKGNRIDIFDETRIWRTNYGQSLPALLYKYINLNRTEGETIVSALLENSNDLGRMLTALNSIEYGDLKNVISAKISNLNLDDYIGSRITITELENALVQAVNSDNYWDQFADKLTQRIKDHYNSRKISDERIQRLLFEVDLVLAYKSGNVDALFKIKTPEALSFGYQPKFDQRKRFFIALFNLFQKGNFQDAIAIFQSLRESDTSNVSYAFHLWRSKTLQALSTKDFNLLSTSYFEWEKFKSDAPLEPREYRGLLDDINSNRIHYLIYAKAYDEVDRILSLLTGKYLYSEEIVSIVYPFYLSRGLHELAFDYLNRATNFYATSRKPIPSTLEAFREQYPDEKTIQKLKLLMANLSCQNADDIPRILPNSINGRKSLSDFILGEIVLASNVMLEKIESVRQITHENRFNDLLIAILRLRFPLWGWTIIDQARVGTSAKDAGEADFLVQVSGKNIALWEALILRDSAYTVDHILRFEKYVRSIKRYYLITYYLGKSSDFQTKWNSYQGDILSLTYPASFAVDATKGFEDLSGGFENVRHLQLAKTSHGEGIEVFHIFVNLGT